MERKIRTAIAKYVDNSPSVETITMKQVRSFISTELSLSADDVKGFKPLIKRLATDIISTKVFIEVFYV
jgi:hypothetical protein